jgi:hypothetical protein
MILIPIVLWHTHKMVDKLILIFNSFHNLSLRMIIRRVLVWIVVLLIVDFKYFQNIDKLTKLSNLTKKTISLIHLIKYLVNKIPVNLVLKENRIINSR